MTNKRGSDFRLRARNKAGGPLRAAKRPRGKARKQACTRIFRFFTTRPGGTDLRPKSGVDVTRAPRLSMALLLLSIVAAPLSAATHSFIVKVANPNSTASATTVHGSNGAAWTQVYIEIPAKLYIDKGWLDSDLDNMRIFDSGKALSHWVRPTKDANLAIDNLGIWVLVENLPNGATKTLRIDMVDDGSYVANPRAPLEKQVHDRTAANAADTVFPLYAEYLSDDQLSSTGTWTSADTEFIVNKLRSEDDYDGDVKEDAAALTGTDFTLSIENMKFYETTDSAAWFYFLSQVEYDNVNEDNHPEDLGQEPGYRLKIDNRTSESDDLHYTRNRFSITLERNVKSSSAEETPTWVQVAQTNSWEPYNNSRHLIDLKVSDTISLYINGRQYPFQNLTAGKYTRSDSWTTGKIGVDRRAWLRSNDTDINHLFLRRYLADEPAFEVYGNTDLVVADGVRTLGQDLIEIAPELQVLEKRVSGNTLDDYIFATYNIARQSQIIQNFKLKLRNRGASAETFGVTLAISNPTNWMIYFCDENGGNCARKTAGSFNVNIAGTGDTTYTVKMIPSPSALFNGASLVLDVGVEGASDASFDSARFKGNIQTNLGCYWRYKDPVDVGWSACHGYTDLSEYQVPVNITSTDLSNARPDGSDIVVTDADGNLITFWIKSFDRSAGTLSLWVRMPTIADGGSQLIVWWGNSDYATSRSDKQATFDLWEDWEQDYALDTPVGCQDGTTECANQPADVHGWQNIPTPDDDYNWWKVAADPTATGQKSLKADVSSTHKSSDTGPYLHQGALGWDHYEVSYRIHSGTYCQYSGCGDPWGNPQFNPVFMNDAGNQWGMEYFADKYIFRPYASGIDYTWQYQTHASNILGENFPKNNKSYWAKVRVFEKRDSGESGLRVLMAKTQPTDTDSDAGYYNLGSFDAPPAFSLDYGEIGFGGWDSGFSFDDIRVRKYIENCSGSEPSVTPGTVATQTPRGSVSLSNPSLSYPLMAGRPAYVEGEAIPFAWLGDLKIYYADCYINGDCRTGESASQLGTVSTLGSVNATTPKGVGYHLMKRVAEENNDTNATARRILTTDGSATTFVDFEIDGCSALKTSLGTGGACDDTDGIHDETERLIRFVRGYHVDTIPRSASRDFDSRTGYGNNDDTPDPNEQWKMGDLVHSNPIMVSIPNMGYGDSSYWTFVNSNDNRDMVAYFMTNEGMLHAVRVAQWDASSETYQPDQSAKELWAFIPNNVLPTLKETGDSEHEYITDGLLRAIDIQISGQWKTVLLGMLGRGGLAYFAMDITNPASPVLLWEKVLPASDRIGTTVSSPALGKLDTNNDGNGDVWVGVFGSGWDTDYANNYENKNAWLTVVRLSDGVIIKQVKVNGKVGNVLTDITPLRRPSDGTLMKIYFGDYYGALWRVGGSRLGNDSTFPPADVTGANPLVEATDMLFKPANYATMVLPGASTRPIIAHPRVAKGVGSDEFWVYVGTGDYNEYESGYSQQAFYGLKDIAATTYVDANLANMTDPTAVNGSATGSWVIHLGDNNLTGADYVINTDSGEKTVKTLNERVLRAAEVYGGFVFFTTYQPSSLALSMACGGGKARFYAVSYLTGGLEQDLFLNVTTDGGATNVSNVRSVELDTVGVPSEARIFEGFDGSGTAIATGVTASSTGDLDMIDLNADKFSTALSILLWREKR